MKATTPLLVAALLAVGLMGCDSFTDGYDRNPNSPTDAPVDLALNSAQVGSMVLQEDNYARIASIWSGQLTGANRQYTSLNDYSATASDFDNMWITGYADVLGDIRPAKAGARESGNRLVLGIAKVVEAHTFGTLAALHGDIPFGEAGAGNENLNPQFSSQADIYSDVVDSLDSAIADLEAGGVSPGSRDVFFGGDAEPWIEVAYTLKARYLLHQGQYENALAAAENGISTSDNNMMGPHGESNNTNANPFYLFAENERPAYMNANDSYAAEILDDTTAGAEYRGNAKTDESARFEYYFVGDQGEYDLNTSEGAYFGQATDYPLVTYAENELIKAEAQLQFEGAGAIGDAVEALNNARNANDDRVAPDTTLYEDYVASDFQDGGVANPQGDSQANALLHEILEEKYLTLMGHIEAFNDIRRTENYIGIPLKGDNDRLPQRFLIAQSEVNANDNVDQIPGVFEPTPVFESLDYTGIQ